MNKFESFRDPGGKVILTDSEVWRLVRPDDAVRVTEFLDSESAAAWRREGKVVGAFPAANGDLEAFRQKFNGTISFPPEAKLFKHDRIEFPSFPYEWSPAMLYDAGKLTIEMAELLLASGWSIKDASPFNILFEASKPVFIDILSFEKRDQRDPVWLPYNQFVQTFILPLLVNKESGIPLQRLFLNTREGMEVSEAARLFDRLKKLKPNVFLLVTLPDLLSRRAEGSAGLYEQKRFSSAERAQFVLKQTFRRLARQLDKVAPRRSQHSDWTEYTKFNQATIPEYMAAKAAFVREAVNELKPENILDVGCNTGFFTFLAAESGARVVAIDHDEAVIDQLYRTACEKKLNVLPLVLNLSRPTPRLGWRYSENPSFLDRAVGRFDLVMMLAVVHHMLVHERIPLREVLRLAADLTNDGLVVEYVPPSDKMFRRLARGRDHLHRDLTADEFTRAASEFFSITRSAELPETERRIYLMRKK